MANQTAGISTYLFEVLSCPICLELFHEPKLLECGHTLCSNCLDNLVKRTDKNTTFKCPQCRRVMLAGQEFRINYALRDVVTRYSFLDRQSSYRNCKLCRQLREKRSIFAAVDNWLNKVKSMFSNTHRLKEETMAKLHMIHEAIEDDIVETQHGNAKIVDLMHQIIHTAQSSARTQFDDVSDRLGSKPSGSKTTDFFDFILADAELVRHRNKEECLRIGGLQESVCEQLQFSLDNMNNEKKQRNLDGQQSAKNSGQ